MLKASILAWPGLRYSEAPVQSTGASEYLSPGHPGHFNKATQALKESCLARVLCNGTPPMPFLAAVLISFRSLLPSSKPCLDAQQPFQKLRVYPSSEPELAIDRHHRHPIPMTGRKFRIAIDINRLQCELKPLLSIF